MDLLFVGFKSTSIQSLVMILVGLILIYLAIKKEYEPLLLLPIGFSTILVNLPLSVVLEHEGVSGFLKILFDTGITTELFPIIIFIAVGAMCDFTPMFTQPVMMFFGAAAQFGIFATILFATLLGFDFKAASAIGIIGAADGPTSIYVATKFAKNYLGAISVAAYSYMSLVPLIQPVVIKSLTTRKERLIRMKKNGKNVPKSLKISFPIIVTLISGFIAPMSVPLIGSLMLGNLLRESGVVEKLSKSAQNELASITTLLLGIAIGSTMQAEKFLTFDTIKIMLLGLFAFIFDTAGGILFAKFLNLFLKNKINPMVGASGISAFPMSARVVHKLAQEEDKNNYILMEAVSANLSGQIGSVIAGGLVLALVPLLMG